MDKIEWLWVLPFLGSLFLIGVGIGLICVYSYYLSVVICGAFCIPFGIVGTVYALKELCTPRVPRW